jgi:hypothetical protein
MLRHQAGAQEGRDMCNTYPSWPSASSALEHPALTQHQLEAITAQLMGYLPGAAALQDAGESGLTDISLVLGGGCSAGRSNARTSCTNAAPSRERCGCLPS